ncbi:MAG: endonuclease V [bacterium]|nr:endonuclease V [bacterium]
MKLEKYEEEQIRTASKVIVKDDFDKIETIAGCDQAFFGNKIISVVVVCDLDMNVIEEQSTVLEEHVPYTPGFLFFREGFAVMDAFNKLKKKPDILMVDGSGILHPLRIGMASHLGVVLDQPTIGITKKQMCGELEKDKIMFNKEVRGIKVQTKEHSNPLFVSSGHRVSLKTCVDLVLKSMRHPHKLPEPIHLAHRSANKMKKELM